MNTIPELEILCEEVMSGQPPEKPELVIVRGAPGSGKSTFAEKQFPDYAEFETDKFFWKRDEHGKVLLDKAGKPIYEFDHKKLTENHRKCLAAVKQSLLSGHNTVVANTFVHHWEIAEYYDFCRRNGFPIRIYRMQNTEFPNDHGVDDETVRRMRTNMRSVDGEFVVPAKAKLEYSEDFAGVGKIGSNMNMWDDEPPWHRKEREMNNRNRRG